MIESFKKYKWHCLTGLAITVLLFMHLFKLSEIPYGLNVDEASGAYDALNIARYGVDRYLKSYPVYFMNYGDGQNAFYIYATAVLIKVFGVSKLVIRASITIAALMGAYFGFRYMAWKWPERQGKLIWLILYAILPVFTMTQRFGLESHLLLAMSMVSLFFVARALDTDKWKFYLAAGMAIGITLYTYALTYIAVPIFLMLVFIYCAGLGKISWKKIGSMFAIVAVLALPLVLVQLINYFDLPEMMIGPFTFTKVFDYRVDEVAGISVLENIKHIFTSTFLYDDLKYNTLQRYGTMFYISIPFILLGIGYGFYEVFVSLKNKIFCYSAPMLFWIVSEWIMGLFLSGSSVPNSTRMIGAFIPMLYFLVTGLYWVWDRMRNVYGKRILAVILSVSYGVAFLSFAKYYFTDYNEDAYPMKWLFYEEYDQVGEFMEENTEASWYGRSVGYPWNYIYYLLEYQVDPYEMNLPVNGFERFRKDYINEYPEEILIEANYVVYKKDLGSLEVLEQIGYEKIDLGDDFWFLVSPLDCYDCTTDEGVFLTIDNFMVDSNDILLTGWSYRKDTKGAFEKLTGEADGMEFVVEMVERQDVAAYLGSTGSVNYGFRVRLPLDIFHNRENLCIIGEGIQGTKETILRLDRK